MPNTKPNTKSRPSLARQDWQRKALMRLHEERQVERKATLTPIDRQKAIQILKELFED